MTARAETELPPVEGPPPLERIAAIDVGSNSIRLSVAEYDPATGLKILDEIKDQPRLASGIAATGRLDPAGMARAIEILQRMREIAERRGVQRMRAVATAAVREADNAREFLDRVRREVGIRLEVVDGETEAALSYRSVAHHFPLAGTRAIVADIGGGSLELIGAVNGLVELTGSLPLGAVRLTETMLRGEEPLPAEIAVLRKRVRKQLKKAWPWRAWTGAFLVGSGGTFTNLGRMIRSRRGGDPGEPVHGEVVTAAEVERLLEWLATKTTEERAQVPGLSPQRADIILAGLAVTAELLGKVETRSVTVSAFGLREGLLLEMVGDDAGRPADPLRAMREFVDRCQGDRRHVEQVRLLAMALFDRLRNAVQADPAERYLLEAASLLHDVGQVVSYRRHHLHSYQLILHAERLSFASRDRNLVAQVSRYHRRRGPSKKHPEFAALPAEDRAIVRRLAGVLRIADGLDRGHASSVGRVTTRLTEDHLTVRIEPKAPGTDLSLEAWGASRKADVLGKVLGRRVVIAVAK